MVTMHFTETDQSLEMVAFAKLALVALACVAMASSPSLPQLGPSQLFGELKAIPHNWSLKGAARQDAKVEAQTGLKQRNMDQLQAKLLDISDPGSDNYGKWMSTKAIDELTKPSDADITAVKSWLTSHGIHQPTSDWIEFIVPVSTMDSLLNIKYEMLTHNLRNSIVPRTQNYSVPRALHALIDLITPNAAFYEHLDGDLAKVSDDVGGVSKRTVCTNSSITLSCLKSMYNVVSLFKPVEDSGLSC